MVRFLYFFRGQNPLFKDNTSEEALRYRSGAAPPIAGRTLQLCATQLDFELLPEDYYLVSVFMCW